VIGAVSVPQATLPIAGSVSIGTTPTTARTQGSVQPQIQLQIQPFI
jgi:hypothetical protein